ncbi:glycine-rich RNA-binding protein 4, mitochondrial-like isoform X1 [Lycium ferocissimum]|uniref:glycine-rich RNA-binding protein 4, mitochondrial-like isoform X1 n=1 Tax=Lycium ferocissimum TaxID=112874 RepID=UPI0028155586|nr:glycine-rich RNA-binding protein 4, mitochondrial-like isoform X1 [Lycium ferocissimum]
MALFNRIGNMLKQSVSKHTNLELCASRTSLYQAIRSMSSSKLFVGGLSYGTDETSLREAFSQHGEVIEARVILDRDTGRSRGFGFVSYTSAEEASSALNALDGQELHGRRVRVNYATEKRQGGFGGGYGSGGGYGGGAGGYGSGSYGGGGNYGTNNSYPAGGGNYGGGVGYGSGEGGNYGGSVGQGNFGGGYGGGNSGNYNAAVSSGNDLFNNSEFGGSSGTSNNGEQLSADQGTETANDDFTPGAEGSHRDDNDEPNDYANSRG